MKPGAISLFLPEEGGLMLIKCTSGWEGGAFLCTAVFITVVQALLFFTKQETQMTFSMYVWIPRQEG